MPGTKPPKSKKRLAAKAALITAAALAMGYVLVFHFPRGGLRAGFGTWSGTHAPPEASGLSSKQREEMTIARAEKIRLAGLAYFADVGVPPTTVSDLVPKYLSEVPRSLISTKPFWIGRSKEPNGFNVHWEAWPNAWYETFWIDEKGEKYADM